MTLEAWLYQWVSLRSGGLRPRTIESYTSLIRLHIAPAIGCKKLAKLKPKHWPYAHGRAMFCAAAVCAAFSGHSAAH